MAKIDIRLGETHYIAGPCKHGQVAPRRISDRHCTCEQCSTSKTARRRDGKRKWHQDNLAAQRENYRRWRIANPDKAAAKTLRWKANNPDAVRAHHAARRARKLNATPPWFGELDELAMREAADLCIRRARITGYDWQADHMVPLQGRKACGLHVASNIQVIPAALNIGKNNRMVFSAPREWLKAI